MKIELLELPATPRDDIPLAEALAVVRDSGICNARYYVTRLLQHHYEATNVPAILETIKEEHPALTASSFNVNNDMLSASLYRSFESRAQMLAWTEENKVELPKECRKYPSVDDDGTISTRIAFDKRVIAGNGIPVEYNLSYDRPGTPKANCRVVTKTSYEVVCDAENPEDATTDDEA